MSDQDSINDKSSTNVSRRRVLQGMLGTGVLIAAGGGGVAAGAAIGSSNLDKHDGKRFEFRGIHQTGVVAETSAMGLLAAFDVVAPDKAALDELFRSLSARIEQLMSGTLTVGDDAPLAPPDDNGVLGVHPPADSLQITIGVGNSLFDSRYGLQSARPRHMQEMTPFTNDALDPKQTGGDLIVQISGDHTDTVLHALRMLQRATRANMTLRWMVEGYSRATGPGTPGKAEARNLLGFKDGSANPDRRSDSLMNRFVWINDGDPEPPWTVGGSYMAVRIIRMFVESWDRVSLNDQQRLIGRRKSDGAPLDGRREDDVPDFAKDVDGKTTPLDSHIRLANPRTEGSEGNTILRRGLSFSRGVDDAGQLDQGLAFVAFQRDLDAGFITVQRRLDGEPLERYLKPVGGGYFFILPGVRDKDDYLGRALLQR